MPHGAGMSKAQSIDTVLPATFIESRSSDRLGSFSRSGAASSAGLPVERSIMLSAGMLIALQMGSHAASFGSSWNHGPNATWMMAAGDTHPILASQVTH